MTGPAPAEIGGRFRLTAPPAVPPPLEPLAALDVKTGAACEVWLVPPGHGGLDHAGQRQAAAGFTGLRHPSLQCLNGVFPGLGGQGACWVYEAPPGKSFEALAAEGRPFTEAEAADMAASLAGALKRLHAAGPLVSHGGISPANIYLAGDGRAVLGGIKPFSRRDTLYDPHGGPGTPAADIYSLGASLVFLLTGGKPRPGGAGGAFGGLDRDLPFSPAFTRILKKMTAPSGRYQSAAELEAELASLLTGRPASGSKTLLRAAAYCVLLAAVVSGARALLLGNGAEKTLKAGAVALEAPGGLAFSADGGRLALAGDTELYIWDTKNWRREKTGGFMSSPGTYTRSVSFLPGGGLVAGSVTGLGTSAAGEGVSHLSILSASPGSRAPLLKIPLAKNLDSAALSPDGRLIAAAVNAYDKTEERYRDGELNVFDTEGRVVHKPALPGGPVHSVYFTPDGSGLVYKTYFWDPAAKAHNFGCVVLRDLGTGSERILFRDKPGAGSGLFSYGPGGLLATPEGREEVLNITGAAGGRLATLNREAYKEEYRYLFLAEGAFSADGKLFAAHFTSRNTVYLRLFETAGWKLLRTFRLGSLDKGGAAAIAFSPDGSRLAAAQGALSSRVHIFKLERQGS